MNFRNHGIFAVMLAVFLLAPCSARKAAADLYQPATMGPNSLHVSSDPDFLSTFHNPAMLGTIHRPRWSIDLPFSDVDVGVWNDKLSIPFLNSDWQKLVSDGDDYLAPILNQSFDLKNKSPEETNRILTDGLKDGVAFCTRFQFSPVSGYFGPVSFDIRTHMEQELHLPGAPFLLLFSDKDGLQSGNSVDFSTFKEKAIVATDVRVAYGRPFTPPSFVKRYLHMDFGSWGVGASYIMGHALIEAAFDSGTARVSPDGFALAVDGSARVTTAGTGLHGAWDDGSVQGIAGNGAGVDAGLMLYNPHSSFGLSICNVGAISWNNVKEAKLRIHNDALDLDALIEGKQDSLFDTTRGNYLSGEGDSLKSKKNYSTTLPAVLDASYSYCWDFSGVGVARWFADYLAPVVRYRQYLVSGPCISLTPTGSFGVKAGALRGFLPLYYGISVGGSEGTASTLGAGLDLRILSLYAVFKAMGSLNLNPERGFEVAFGVKANPGF